MEKKKIIILEYSGNVLENFILCRINFCKGKMWYVVFNSNKVCVLG